MKKLLLWIAKLCKIDLIKYVTITVTKADTIYVTLDNEVNHDVIVNGNLTVIGKLNVSGEITCYKINNK